MEQNNRENIYEVTTKNEALFALSRIREKQEVWIRLYETALELGRPNCLGPIRQILQAEGLIREPANGCRDNVDNNPGFIVNSKHLEYACNEVNILNRNESFAIFAVFWAMEGEIFNH